MQKKIADKNNYYIRSKECHIKIYNFKKKTKKLNAHTKDVAMKK